MYSVIAAQTKAVQDQECFGVFVGRAVGNDPLG